MKKIVWTLIIAALGTGVVFAFRYQPPANSATSTNLSTPTSNTTQTSSGNSQPPASTAAAHYKDGSYTGDAVDVGFGTVQVAVKVSGGQITDVQFLQMPNDTGHSYQLSQYSAPILKQQTIAAQSSQIDGVSGATSTSEGYMQSLQSALSQAQ